MRVRNAILTALLAAAGVAVCADDAQAIGRRKKKAANCNSCTAPAMAAPAPCCGGGGPGYIGNAGMPYPMVGVAGSNGNVIVSGERVPNPMPVVGTTTNLTTIPATSAIPVTFANGGTGYSNGTVIPATYAGGYPGSIVPASASVAPMRRGLFRR